MSLDLDFSFARIFTPIAKIRRIVEKSADVPGAPISTTMEREATKPALSVRNDALIAENESIEMERPNPNEVEMRTIDEIVAATLKTTEASLREAFEAGRAHTASALKARMAAFFEGLISEAEGKIAAVAAQPHGEPAHPPEPHLEPPPSEPHHVEPQPDAHHG